MQTVIPMSGFGERFRRAGYLLPKPLIEIDFQGCQEFDPYYSFNPEKNGYKEISMKSLGRPEVIFLKKSIN